MARSEIKETTVKDTKKWKCNGAKQSSTKLFQGKVAEREVQDEFIESGKKKKTGYRVTQKVWSSVVIKKQGGHGNVTAAENKNKKNTILNLKQIRILHTHRQPALESKQ